MSVFWFHHKNKTRQRKHAIAYDLYINAIELYIVTTSLIHCVYACEITHISCYNHCYVLEDWKFSPYIFNAIAIIQYKYLYRLPDFVLAMPMSWVKYLKTFETIADLWLCDLTVILSFILYCPEFPFIFYRRG